MKYLLVGAIIFVAVIIGRTLLGSQQQTGTKGYLADLGTYLQALSKSGDEDSFLIVTIDGTDDFFQFKHYQDGTFEIDFPVITDRQKSLETKVRSAHTALGLSYEIVEGSDDSRFIDVYKKMTNQEAAEAAKSLFSQVYQATETTELVFSWRGFDSPVPVTQ